MYPILYQYSILGQQRVIAGYGLLVALGLVAGMGLLLLLARRRGLNVVNTLLVSLIAIGAGLIGSYLLFVITVLPEALQDPSILATGGLVFYGGPLAAVPAGWIAARRLEVPALKLADIAVPSLALGHALGRMGCFLGGCCFGGKSEGPLAVVFTHPLAPAAHQAVPRYPVQLYESLFLVVMVLVLMLAWRWTRGNGRIAFLYLFAYSAWRVFIETLRADVVRGYVIPGLLTTSQAISVALIPVALLGYFLIVRIGRKSFGSG